MYCADHIITIVKKIQQAYKKLTQVKDCYLLIKTNILKLTTIYIPFLVKYMPIVCSTFYTLSCNKCPLCEVI
jgi:hypothetical protein